MMFPSSEEIRRGLGCIAVLLMALGAAITLAIMSLL